MAEPQRAAFPPGSIVSCSQATKAVREANGDRIIAVVPSRKGSHGAGSYALPGGHLEYGESFEACGAREVLEETGIVLDNVQFAHATNNIIETKHYVTIFVRATVSPDTDAQLMEPHKCEGWHWVPLDQIPAPHFPPLASLLDSGFTL